MAELNNIVKENPESEVSSEEDLVSIQEEEAIKIIPIEIDIVSDSPPRKTVEELAAEKKLKKELSLAV